MLGKSDNPVGTTDGNISVGPTETMDVGSPLGLTDGICDCEDGLNDDKTMLGANVGAYDGESDGPADAIPELGSSDKNGPEDGKDASVVRVVGLADESDLDGSIVVVLEGSAD